MNEFSACFFPAPLPHTERFVSKQLVVASSDGARRSLHGHVFLFTVGVSDELSRSGRAAARQPVRPPRGTVNRDRCPGDSLANDLAGRRLGLRSRDKNTSLKDKVLPGDTSFFLAR